MKSTAFWDVTPCCLIDRHKQDYADITFFPANGGGKSLKSGRYASTKLHRVTSQNTTVLITSVIFLTHHNIFDLNTLKT